jgi:hypothetical protein
MRYAVVADQHREQNEARFDAEPAIIDALGTPSGRIAGKPDRTRFRPQRPWLCSVKSRRTAFSTANAGLHWSARARKAPPMAAEERIRSRCEGRVRHRE